MLFDARGRSRGQRDRDGSRVEREHTRLTVKALEWEQAGRDQSFPLGGRIWRRGSGGWLMAPGRTPVRLRSSRRPARSAGCGVASTANAGRGQPRRHGRRAWPAGVRVDRAWSGDRCSQHRELARAGGGEPDAALGRSRAFHPPGQRRCAHLANARVLLCAARRARCVADSLPAPGRGVADLHPGFLDALRPAPGIAFNPDGRQLAEGVGPWGRHPRPCDLGPCAPADQGRRARGRGRLQP